MGVKTTVFSCLFLALGGFGFGYDSGIITSTIALPRFEDFFDSPSDTVVGGIVSSFQGGAILGTIFNMFFAHALGRRWTVFIGSVVSVIGGSLQAGAVNMPMLIIGRFIGGVSVGQLTSTIPMYASELSEPQHRGVLAGLMQWTLSWGFLTAQWLGYGCSFSTSSFSWRFPLAFQNVPNIILICGIFFLEESPRWLMERDRYDEARKTLNKLRSGRDSFIIDLEFREIRDVILADRAQLGDITWKSILTKPSWRRRLVLGCGVHMFSQLSGVNVINYYGPRIYRILGITTRESLLIIGIQGALAIIWNTLVLWSLDRIGRVKPLMVSVFGMGSALLVNAIQGQLLDPNNEHQLRSMVAMNFVFSLFFTPTGIVSWVYPAEIFPVEVRALGNAISVFVNWTTNLIFAQFSPAALTAIEFGYFYVFFVFNLIAFFCYWFFYPETKGRTLEAMDELFGDKIVPHAMNDPVAAKEAFANDEKLVQQVEAVQGKKEGVSEGASELGTKTDV